jgi:hypothetical protein
MDQVHRTDGNNRVMNVWPVLGVRDVWVWFMNLRQYHVLQTSLRIPTRTPSGREPADPSSSVSDTISTYLHKP